MESSGFRECYCTVTVPSDKLSLPPPLIKSAEREAKLMSCTGVWKNLQPFEELAALLGILKTPTASFLGHILRAYSTGFKLVQSIWRTFYHPAVLDDSKMKPNVLKLSVNVNTKGSLNALLAYSRKESYINVSALKDVLLSS